MKLLARAVHNARQTGEQRLQENKRKRAGHRHQR